MNSHARRAVVVGVDGSDAALGAFAHGAWEAHRRGLPLRLLHSYPTVIPYAVVGFASDPAELTYPESVGRELVADLEAKARQAFPDLEVDTVVLAGSAGAVLVDASAHAELVVVGSRGLGGFSGLLLGSAGAQLAAHSRAPVVVVRPPGDPGALGAGPPYGAVVVGVDGLPDCQAAVEFAFDQASARKVPLRAVYAWWMLPLGNLGPIDVRHYDLDAAAEEARRLLAESMAGFGENYPDVEVDLVAAHSLNPALALLDECADAGLLVVSRHGGNIVSRLILGSVSDIAVREAPCPVAVVPEPGA
jgi:nucleotide-binding universal stress UspA family protein